MKPMILIPAALLLSGCAMLDRLTGPATPAAAVEPAAPLTALAPIAPEGAQTAAALDQTTEAEVAAAVAPAVAGARELGRTVVALGSPAEQGFWLSTSLVSVAGPGRVVADGGASVNVELRPGSGGSLLSLAAFRQLGFGLTDLPEVTVLAD